MNIELVNRMRGVLAAISLVGRSVYETGEGDEFRKTLLTLSDLAEKELNQSKAIQEAFQKNPVSFPSYMVWSDSEPPRDPEINVLPEVHVPAVTKILHSHMVVWSDVISRRHGKNVSSARAHIIHHLKMCGMKNAEIAKIMDRSPHSIPVMLRGYRIRG